MAGTRAAGSDDCLLSMDDLTCPLSMEPLVSPVTLVCGHTFSKVEIRRCLARHETDCPLAAPLPPLSVLPNLPGGDDVALSCGHVYEREVIRSLLELQHEKCAVCCGSMVASTAPSQLKTNKCYASVMDCLTASYAAGRELEVLGPGDTLVLRDDAVADIRILLTCRLTGQLLRDPVTLCCGCTFSREPLVEKIEANVFSCPSCSRLQALPASVHGLHLNLGLAGILTALQPPSSALPLDSMDKAAHVRPITSMEELTAAGLGGEGRLRHHQRPPSSNMGFLPPSLLATGRGAAGRPGGGGGGSRSGALAAVESDQLDFLVGYEGDRDADRLPHGFGRWRSSPLSRGSGGAAAASSPRGGGGGGVISYEGQWIRGRFEGQGTLFFDGCVYRGQWLRGRFHGRGSLRTSSWEYEGTFCEGERLQGRSVYSNGDVFTGWWDRGIKLSGTYQYENGDCFKGRFVLERPVSGIMAYHDGRIYQGSFGPSGLPEGAGTIRYVDGSIYSGDLHRGCPGACRVRHCPEEADGFITEAAVGSGSMRYASGHVYTGQFKVSEVALGVQNDESWAGSSRDEAMLCCSVSQDGKRHGSGLLKFKVPGGKPLVFLGDWEEGRREGRGRLYQGAGRVLHGIWRQGKRERPTTDASYEAEGEEGEEDVDMESILLLGEPQYVPTSNAITRDAEEHKREDGQGVAPISGGAASLMCSSSPSISSSSSSSSAAAAAATSVTSPPGVAPTCRIESVTLASAVTSVMPPSSSSPTPPSPLSSASATSSSPHHDGQAEATAAASASSAPFAPDEDMADRSPTSAA